MYYSLDKETLHWINHQALILSAVEEDYLQAPHSQGITNYLKDKRKGQKGKCIYYCFKMAVIVYKKKKILDSLELKRIHYHPCSRKVAGIIASKR